MMRLIARSAQSRARARRIAEREIVRLRERCWIEPLLLRLFFDFRIDSGDNIDAQIADDPTGAVEQWTKNERSAAAPRSQPAQAQPSEQRGKRPRHWIVIVEKLPALAERQFVGVTDLHRMRHIPS